MLRSGKNSERVSHRDSLPLFRPEALAAQQKLHGEIVLIRPLSLQLLAAVGVLIAAALLVFLFAGRYTEKVRIPAMFLADAETATSPSLPPTAVFYVPARWMQFALPGTQVGLRCRICPDPSRRFTGTIRQVSAPVAGTKNAGALASAPGAHELVYRVTTSLPPEILRWLQDPAASSDASLEVEIPLGRKPLTHWLFPRTGT